MSSDPQLDMSLVHCYLKMENLEVRSSTLVTPTLYILSCPQRAAADLLTTSAEHLPAMAAIHISTMSTPLTGYFGGSSVDPGNLNQLARSLFIASISCSGGHEFESLVGQNLHVSQSEN
jgi:hypothetical protein